MPRIHAQHYGALSQLLHWLTAIAVLAAFIYGPGGPESRVYSPEVDADRRLHETLGLTVFALVVLRVLWRTMAASPDAASGPRWMHLAARIVHGLLILLLFLVPLTAMTGAWLEGHPLGLLGGVQFAPLLAENHALGTEVAEIHAWLGDVILWVAGAHAAAALYHHFVLRDGVLLSMLPRRFGPR